MILRQIFIIMFLLISTKASADPSTDFAAYLEQEIDVFDKAVNTYVPSSPNTFDASMASDSESQGIETLDQSLSLQRLLIRIRPHVDYVFPGLISVQIMPEIEMLWARQPQKQ